jgi:hypothetical protein
MDFESVFKNGSIVQLPTVIDWLPQLVRKPHPPDARMTSKGTVTRIQAGVSDTRY